MREKNRETERKVECSFLWDLEVDDGKIEDGEKREREKEKDGKIEAH